MAGYGQALKNRAVARLLPPESSPVEILSREIGVSVATPERWRSEALLLPAGKRVWTAAVRLEAVIVTASMDDEAKSGWCQEQGLYLSELETWRQGTTAALAEPEVVRASPHQTRHAKKRIKEWSVSSSARTRRWPRQRPCWCCQKSSRRSTGRARTNDPSGRSPGDGSGHEHADAAGARLGSVNFNQYHEKAYPRTFGSLCVCKKSRKVLAIIDKRLPIL